MNIIFCAVKTTLRAYSNFIHHLGKKSYLSIYFLHSLVRDDQNAKLKRLFKACMNFNILPKECYFFFLKCMWELLTELNNYRILHAAAKSLQSCPTLCYPIDGSPPGSPFPGIFQARALEWVAISFSNITFTLHEKHIDGNHIRKEKQRKFFNWVAQPRSSWAMKILNHIWSKICFGVAAFQRKISDLSKSL